MSKPVLVLGAGGHSKVLIEALLLSGTVIAGIVDPDSALLGTKILGVSVIGADETINEFPSEEILLVNGLGSIGRPGRRMQIFELFSKKGYFFTSVIHPSA